MTLRRELGVVSSTFVVIASMIGTGIFVTTGIILDMTKSPEVVLLLWGVAGAIAVAGALCYAELAAMMPHVGGEYIYLKRTFGLLPAFLTGWISLVVGFTASIAVSSVTLVHYLKEFLSTYYPGNLLGVALSSTFTQKLIGCLIIAFFGIVHMSGVRSGSLVQNILTVFKICIVAALSFFGLAYIDWQQSYYLSTKEASIPSSTIASYGLPLLIIMFAYSGWNGAAYIAGEVKDPDRTVPKALLWGVLLTSMVYILLNIVYLASAPVETLTSNENRIIVGLVAARSIFGNGISYWFSLGIIIILLSSISVQLMIGPRVYYAMATDRVLFSWLSRISPRFRTPVLSIALQVLLAIAYVMVGSPETLLEYLGFALSVFPVLTIIGLIYLRIKRPDLPRPYKVIGYPFTPLLFIGGSLYMMASAISEWSRTSFVAIGVVLLGIPIFYLWQAVTKPSASRNTMRQTGGN